MRYEDAKPGQFVLGACTPCSLESEQYKNPGCTPARKQSISIYCNIITGCKHEISLKIPYATQMWSLGSDHVCCSGWNAARGTHSHWSCPPEEVNAQHSNASMIIETGWNRANYQSAGLVLATNLFEWSMMYSSLARLLILYVSRGNTRASCI